MAAAGLSVSLLVVAKSGRQGFQSPSRHDLDAERKEMEEDSIGLVY